MKLTVNGCDGCKTSGNQQKFSVENNMDVGMIPDELRDLTYIEQMLIARCHPVVSLYRINGSQYGYSGNVINFKQNIEEYIDVLPRPLDELTSTLVFNKHTKAGVAQFRVRAQKVLNALLKLKEINIYYKSITISHENLSQLPEDGNCIDLIQSVDADEVEIDDSHDNDCILDQTNVFSVCNIDNDSFINRELNLDYPTTEKEPINEFTSEGYIACAFPTLFPTGNGDYLQPRKKSLTRHKYFKYLMEYHDGRFARDPRNEHRKSRIKCI